MSDQGVKMPLESIETEQEDAKKIYEKWFLNRPPFSNLIEDPEYKGIQKGPVYALEAKAFSADEILTPPDPSQTTLVEAFQKIQSCSKDLKENIKKIKGNRTQENSEEQKKKTYKDHHELKKHFFQSVIIYLTLWMNNEKTKGNTQTQKYKDYEILFHQVEAIHLAHQSYSTVLTFVHAFEPLRESGDLVMDHAYNICIRGMNKYLKRIFAEEDHSKRVALYHRMKKSIVVRLCHDMGEDFRRQWTSKIFEDTIKRIAGAFDSRILNLLFMKEVEAEKEEDVENPHFISKEWPSIERMINALTKPKNKTDRPGYLRRQTLDNKDLTEEELEDVIDAKNDDRLDNLATLKYMKGKPQEDETPIQTQLRKIEETIELIDLNEEFCRRKGQDCEQMKENSKDNIDACLNELERLQEEGQLTADEAIKVTQLKEQFEAIERT